MNCGDISDSVFCAGMAVAKDLPDIEYTCQPYTVNLLNRATKGAKLVEPAKEPEKRKRRPHLQELDVHSFPQGWGSTALGFGGIGGQACTTAQTTVVISEGRQAAVYFGRQLAYVVPVTQALMADIASNRMEAVSRSEKYRSAK